MKYKGFLIGVYAQLLIVLFQKVTRNIFAVIMIIEAREASLPRLHPRHHLGWPGALTRHKIQYHISRRKTRWKSAKYGWKAR